MDGWRMVIGRDSTCWNVHGRVEDWIVLRFGVIWFWIGLSQVWLLLVIHVSSSQDRRRVPSPTGFAGVLRNFCGLSVGRWTEKETDNMKFQKLFENPNNFCASL
jgi:hypothetical protein